MEDSDLEMGNEMLVDETICLVCGGSTFVGETISCETCLRWFHFNCVGVTHSDPCVQSEDVPYFCPSCDVQNRKAKKAKRQSQAKDQKARTAALQAEAAHSEDLKVMSSVKSEETFLDVKSNELSSMVITDTSGHFGQEGLSIGSLGQNVIIADLGSSSKSYFEQEGMEEVQEMKITETSDEDSDEDSEEEQLIIDTQGRLKGSKKSDKSGVVTQMMPQVEVPICLMEQNHMVVGGNSEE